MDRESIFFYGGIDKDSAIEFIKDGAYIDALNGRPYGDESERGVFSPIEGNRLIENKYMSDIFEGQDSRWNILSRVVQGRVEHEATNKLYYFVKNIYGQEGVFIKTLYDIYEFDSVEKEITGWVLSASFKLFEDEHISAAVDDGWLYWTSKDGTPFVVNIEKGKNTFESIYSGDEPTGEFYPEISREVFTLANQTPSQAPIASYSIDDSVKVNNVRGNVFKFRYAWGFEDGTKSVYSPMSNAVILESDLAPDGNQIPIDFNCIDVLIETPPPGVKTVYIAEQHINTDGELSTWSVFDKLKAGETSVRFYNDSFGTELTLNESAKLFDSIPQTADTLELISNPTRLTLGGCREDYDNIDIDAEVSVHATAPDADGGNVSKNAAFPYLFQVHNVDDDPSDFFLLYNMKRIWGSAYYAMEGIVSQLSLAGITDEYASSSSIYSIVITAPVDGTVISEDIDISTATTANEARSLILAHMQSEYPGLVFSSKSALFDDMYGGFDELSHTTSGELSIGDYVYNGTAVGTVKNKWIYSSNYSLITESDVSLYVKTGRILKLNGANVRTAKAIQVAVTNFRNSFLDDTNVLNVFQEYAYDDYWDELLSPDPTIVPRTPATSLLAIRFGDMYAAGNYTNDTELSPSSGYPEMTVEYVPSDGSEGVISPVLVSSAGTSSSGATLTPFGRYPVGIVYFDEYMRAGYVQKIGDIDVDIEGYGAYKYHPKIKINHRAPSWAKHWSVVIGDNNKFSYYLNIDTRTYVSSEYSTNYTVNPISGKRRVNVGAVISAWQDDFGERYQQGLYEFVAGDRAVIQPTSDTPYMDREILSQDDSFNNITLNVDEDELASRFLFIYRPKKQPPVDLYYEIGGVNQIAPGGLHVTSSDSQTFASPLEFIVETGDSYVETQNYHLGYNSYSSIGTAIYSYNASLLYKSKMNDFGRVHVTNEDVENKKYDTRIRWSKAYVQDSLVNGIRTFDSGDKSDMPSKHGGITEMFEIGYTLKVLTKEKNISIYVGRTSPISPDGSEDIYLTNVPLGTVRIPESNNGCQHPDSIVRLDRSLIYANADSGEVVMDTAAGASLISDRGMSRYWADKLDNNTGNIYAAINRRTKEYVIVFNDEAWMYSYAAQKWNGKISIHDGEMAGFVSTSMASFKNGQLYLHDGEECEFFGEVVNPYIKFAVNQNSKQIKVFNSLAVHTHGVVWAPNENGNILLPLEGMSSRILPNKFVNKEGVFYANFMRDGLTPGKTYDEGIVDGRKLRGRYAILQLNGEPQSNLSTVSVLYVNSSFNF